MEEVASGSRAVSVILGHEYEGNGAGNRDRSITLFVSAPKDKDPKQRLALALYGRASFELFSKMPFDVKLFRVDILRPGYVASGYDKHFGSDPPTSLGQYVLCPADGKVQVFQSTTARGQDLSTFFVTTASSSVAAAFEKKRKYDEEDDSGEPPKKKARTRVSDILSKFVDTGDQKAAVAAFAELGMPVPGGELTPTMVAAALTEVHSYKDAVDALVRARQQRLGIEAVTIPLKAFLAKQPKQQLAQVDKALAAADPWGALLSLIGQLRSRSASDAVVEKLFSALPPAECKELLAKFAAQDEESCVYRFLAKYIRDTKPDTPARLRVLTAIKDATVICGYDRSLPAEAFDALYSELSAYTF